jgi:hypothetical protein
VVLVDYWADQSLSAHLSGDFIGPISVIIWALTLLPLLNFEWVDLGRSGWQSGSRAGEARRSEPLTPGASPYAGRHGRCGMLTHRPMTSRSVFYA